MNRVQFSQEGEQQLLCLALKYESVTGMSVRWRKSTGALAAMVEHGLYCGEKELEKLARGFLKMITDAERKHLMDELEVLPTAQQEELRQLRIYRGSVATPEEALVSPALSPEGAGALATSSKLYRGVAMALPDAPTQKRPGKQRRYRGVVIDE